MEPSKPVKRLENKKRLSELEQEIKKTKAEMDALGKKISQAKKQERIYKLIKAGEVIEEAGLLDVYDPNDLYTLLVLNRDKLVQNKDGGK